MIDVDSIYGKETLKKYQDIAQELEFLPRASYFLNTKTNNYKRRIKYKLLEKQGSGFLFFSKSPIVIPSNKKKLLRALMVAIAELRAGNKFMKNIVVPLALEEKRRHILPKRNSYTRRINLVLCIKTISTK